MIKVLMNIFLKIYIEFLQVENSVIEIGANPIFWNKSFMFFWSSKRRFLSSKSLDSIAFTNV